MKITQFLFLAAILSLATAFTYSCSSEDSGEGNNNNQGGEIPSSSSEVIYVPPSSSSVVVYVPPSSSSAIVYVPSSSSINTPSSSNVVQTIGYCDYGPIQANGDGGCFPMGTADDFANYQQWGKVVTACPTLSKCGTRTEAFDPDLYSCSGNVIRLKNPVYHGGQPYQAVLIGTQVWMARNLNINPGAGNSKCPGNIAENCDIYGRQYDWTTAIGLCPTGWHIPSAAEWSTLVSFVGSNAGIKLRSPTSTSTYQGTNDYGFGALLGGYVEYGTIVDSYREIDNIGYWWTATEYNANYAYNIAMSKARNDVMRTGDQNYDYSMTKRNMLSVRCIKN
jgi:uncharacterized protein (TIGR02145 family)